MEILKNFNWTYSTTNLPLIFSIDIEKTVSRANKANADTPDKNNSKGIMIFFMRIFDVAIASL